MNNKNNLKSVKLKISNFINSLKDKNKVLIIALAVAVGLSVFGYAMSVDKFTDYNPPSTIMLEWRDYISGSGYSNNNAITSTPAWTAEYPYRVILFGAKYASSHEQRHDSQYTIIYSKKPTIDMFTFQYHAGSRLEFDQGTLGAWGKRGYIRAYFNYAQYANSDDVRIVSANGIGVSSGTSPLISGSQTPFLNFDIMGLYRVNGFYFDFNDCYFDFDFYYECTAEHQQNAYPLNVSGLRSVANVPYAYILKCDNHGGPAGSTSGSGGSSGGSGGGSSYTGGDTSYGGSGRDGSPYVDTPPYNGSNAPNRPDHELSVPDSWTSSTGGGSNPDNYPWEDDSNIPSDNFTIEPEPYDIRGDEYDTGERGGTWDIPEFDIPMELPFTDNDVVIPPAPDFNFPPVPVPDFDFPSPPDFDAGYSYNWPPPFPVN